MASPLANSPYEYSCDCLTNALIFVYVHALFTSISIATTLTAQAINLGSSLGCVNFLRSVCAIYNELFNADFLKRQIIVFVIHFYGFGNLNFIEHLATGIGLSQVEKGLNHLIP